MPEGTLHAVVLAGGSGTRFWPLSRKMMPKQLLSIVGDRSMLALTFDRVARIIPEKQSWIVTTRAQADQVRREMRDAKMGGIHVLEEPAGRNTAAAIGLAAVLVARRDPDAILAVFPADHHIQKPERFTELIEAAAGVAEEGWLVTLGIEPTRPETGYGYIQRGSPLELPSGGSPPSEAFRVARFAEKPDVKTAERYLASGDFYWNAGIFVWRADRFLAEMESYLPEHYAGLQEIASLLGESGEPDLERVDGIYRGLESISVDYGIMERSDRVAVLPAEMGWSDVGSWASLRELLDKDDRGNILQGDVMALDTTGCLVRSEDRLVATLGLNGLIVVDTADALLICPEGRSQDVKKFPELLMEAGRPEALVHRKILTRWGSYRVLELEEGYQVRCLDVSPGEHLCSHSHQNRVESWTVVQGVATVTLDDRVLEVARGEQVCIPCRTPHRLENRTGAELRVVEVQSGDTLEEEDVVRHT